MAQQFCLKWNNHMNNMMDVFKNLLSTESMVDVTLACDGLSLKAHKIVLSACSPFFQSLFLENPCKHPIVILKDMKYSELKAIIEFMYHGEVNVAQDQLSALMKTAETLRVKGLAEMPNEKSSSNASQEEPGHRSVPRTETPPPSSKRRRGRVRKRSLSDSNRSDDSNETKIKQPPSPDIEELSGDVTMDTSGQFSNLQSQVPMQSLPSHSTNSYQKTSSVVSQDPQIEEPASADESEFGVEPAKLLEQTLTTDDLSNARRSGRSSVSGMEMQRRPRSSTDHSSNLVPTSMPSEALGSNQQPESPPDIKPELLELDPPMSPVAGPSHSTDNSMMMYMDQSSVSSHPGTSYQDNTALVPQDSQPQGKGTLRAKEAVHTVLVGEGILKLKEAVHAVLVDRGAPKVQKAVHSAVVAKGALNVQETVHTELKELNKKYAEISEQLNKFRIINPNVYSDYASAVPNVQPDVELPVLTDEALYDLNKKLTDRSLAAALVQFLCATCIGRAAGPFLLNVMRKVLSRHVAVQYSRYGRKGKKSFIQVSNVFNIIVDTCSLKFPDVQREAIFEIIGRVLAGAGDWDGGRVRRG